MCSRCAVLFCLLTLLGSFPAMGADLIISRALHSDPTGTQTIGDVMSAVFQPIGPAFSRGFTHDTQWVRITVGVPVTLESVPCR